MSTVPTFTYSATLPDGGVVTRKSPRTYTHVVVAYRAVSTDKWDRVGWHLIGWTGRLDLAMKLAATTAQLRPAVGYTMKGTNARSRVARVVREGELIYSDVQTIRVEVTHTSTPRPAASRAWIASSWQAQRRAAELLHGVIGLANLGAFIPTGGIAGTSEEG